MSVRPLPRAVRAGILLAIAAVLFGFVLGGALGGIEDTLKGKLKASGERALATAYQGDVAAKEAVVAKSWEYLKRAHMHGGGMGSAALASIAILILTTTLGPIARASAAAFGSGALLYSLFWLIAGFTAPGMGSTAAAKEAFNWIAIPGAGFAILGALGTMVAVIVERPDKRG